MAYIVITEPDGVTLDMYDAVNEKLYATGPPPPELQVHTAGVDASGQFRVVDVWDSVEAHDRFREERLLPAIGEVMRERGMEMPDGPPANNVYEAHNVALRPESVATA